MLLSCFDPILQLNPYEPVVKEQIPEYTKIILHLPPKPWVTLVIKTCEIPEQIPVNDVLRDILHRDFTLASDMRHDTPGLDRGKERRGAGAIDQAHPDKKQIGIVEGSDERAQFWAQLINGINRAIFR